MSEETSKSRRLTAFRELGRERLGRINMTWLQFEQGQATSAHVDELLREAHTLKGEASLMGQTALAEAAHVAEELILAAIRRKEAPGELLADLVIQGLDVLGALLEGGAPEGGRRAFYSAANAWLETQRTTGGGGPVPGAVATGSTAPAPEKAPAVAEGPGAPGSPERGEVAVRALDLAVRVTAKQLDRMRQVIGEFLVVRARLRRVAAEVHAKEGLERVEEQLKEDVHDLGTWITALDDVTRELRMSPVGDLFEQYPRAVRELARTLDKKVRLELEGTRSEADREVLEALGEPLLHLVRNAVDHGLETPAERVAAGKQETGVLRLRAQAHGDSLEVEVIDDGAGIDVDRVRERSVEMGLLEAPSARVLPDEKVLDYLFSSGFSTKKVVTAVSGRGVGLDAVRTAVSGIGGQVFLSSVRGKGTTFRLIVPITVSISSLMLFRVGQKRYALPSSTVVAVVDVETYATVEGIEGPCISYRGALIPRIPMDRVLGEAPSPAHELKRYVIVSCGDRLAALAGTYLHQDAEAVIKPPGRLLAKHGLVTGGVALEDGAVALVLDGLGVLRMHRQSSLRSDVTAVPETVAAQRGRRVLMAEDSPIMRDVIAEALRSFGVDVVECKDGAEALARYEADPTVDLLVTDLEMPRMDGFELIRRVRQIKTARRVPAVVISTRGSDADKLAAIEVGADAYLVKSGFSRDGLWNVVGRFLA